MTAQWFVVRTKQAKEVVAAASIASEGFHTFLPVEMVERSHAGKRERVSKPLFPRYLFVEFDPEAEPFGKLNYCRGVANKGLMCDAMDRPIAIRPKVMERIREGDRARMAKVGEVTTGYRPGDTFLLARGPYAHIEATYIGEENGEVFVTITLFGRGFLQTIAFEDVPLYRNSIDKISA